MINNEEKLKISDDLQKLSDENPNGVFDQAVAQKLMLEYCPDNLNKNMFTSQSVSYLSKLIRPKPERTCHLVYDERMSSLCMGPMLRCDSCNNGLEEGDYDYCPRCGAKVISEGDM